MALSAEMLELAVELIAEYGVDVPITRPGTGGAYDTTQGKRTGSAPQNMTVKALPENKGLWLGKDLGVVGEKKLTVACDSLTFMPAPGDKFTSGGKGYTVVDKGVVVTELQGVNIIAEIYGVSA
jgi:hypothetical protein